VLRRTLCGSIQTLPPATGALRPAFCFHESSGHDVHSAVHVKGSPGQPLGKWGGRAWDARFHS
jgi:hypothetical protein